MKMIRGFQRRIKNAGKAAAYSPLGTELARKIMASRPETRARQFLKAKGLEGSVRRIASESLPEGLFFAKLTIHDWENRRGQGFQLLQDSTVVYGNEIEPPARGFPLEYRNIIVSSDDVSRFKLTIDAPFDLKIGRGAFTTPQQLKYDHQYGVEQHGDVYYSLRGNTTNPKKLLITFPGFGPSTSRISYAVSYLKAITDTDLNETLMVCFQDRYLAAGSYMMVDSAGRPLYDRVWRAIEDLRTQYGVDPTEMLLFGASKGGSIAIHYAKDFPDAQLLLAVPQMNLPYYFNKPFFKDNLFRNRALHEIEQPEVLLRQYFAEGRKIDYFYTNSDELSNHSLIELVQDVPNLTKYRVDGGHSAVARAALPTMLCIIREFLTAPQPKSFVCEDIRTFHDDDTLRVQLRVDSAASEVKGANWFIEGSLGRTRFMQLLTDHSYKFVKLTSEGQRLFAAYDPIEDLSAVTAIEENGTRWSSLLPEPVRRGPEQCLQTKLSSSELNLQTAGLEEYVVLDGDHFGHYRYRCQKVSESGDTVEVHFVSDVEAEVKEVEDRNRKASHIAVVEPQGEWVLADLVALRFVVAAGVERLLMVVHGNAPTPEALSALTGVGWKDSTVLEVASADDADFDDAATWGTASEGENAADGFVSVAR
ncbi:hypothetical protein [Paenarthrobacter sp. 2TAF44]|uniref:hypothetical protein n=1 Tax=Paenarthrobacter sp. 2TAF44 TaxID=3233018 RepID=UPI003F96B6C0